MTDLSQPEGAPFRLDESKAPVLDARLLDALVALVTGAASLSVLAYSLSAAAIFPLCLLMHLAVVGLTAGYLAIRVRQNSDLTVPFILLLATAATGPVGAIGCAGMALSLWSRHPSPSRLQEWYDYISGVVARTRVAHLHDELVAGRLPSDPAAAVPRFTPILQGDFGRGSATRARRDRPALSRRLPPGPAAGAAQPQRLHPRPGGRGRKPPQLQ